jgi:hypothetical protein
MVPVKLAVAVAASTVVTIMVPKSERRFSALLYDRKDFADIDYTRGVLLRFGDLQTTFRACADHETWFSGGFLIKLARCVELDVYARGRIDRVRVPFGVANCQ